MYRSCHLRAGLRALQRIQAFSQRAFVSFIHRQYFYVRPLCKGKKTQGNIAYKDAITVGLFQGVALLPGVSRSGSTISAGLFSGMNRETSVKYSFILGIPVILMSCLLEVKDAVSTHADIDWVSCAVGFVVAAFVGLCAIKLVNWLVKTDKFKVFAYYTLVLGVIVLVISFIEMCMGHPISFAK